MLLDILTCPAKFFIGMGFVALITLMAVGDCGVLMAVEKVEFNRDVRPLLAKNCFVCHGLDPESRQAELRLDDRTVAIEAGVIVPGDADKSDLIKRIESRAPKLQMPPPDSGKGLTRDEVATLRAWIAQGATYQSHWSFAPPIKATLPSVKQADWPTQPLDYFVLHRMEAVGLEPSEVEEKLRLLRRVSLDLTGLPPTIEQADAFLADDSVAAYEKVVDQLLNSDAYGEHWARMWLDLARYADTKGYEKDRHREIWRYRDWVIEAFNKDMPFDQFTIEQLAGDLLPNRTDDQILATAFHRNTMTNDEGGTDDEEFRVTAVKDRVDTTMQVWMGLTMGCAKCHTHKYDPITTESYYSFFAFFNQTQDADNEVPVYPTPTHAQAQQIAKLKAELTGSELSDADRKMLQQQLAQLEKVVVKTPVMLELPEGKKRQTKIHVRGNFLDQGKLVNPSVPTIFGEFPADAPADRLGVAAWLVQPENPLTARVMVNRIWARIFGLGLVETEEDFGTQGALPSHPELLDWLAVDFREHGWSIKKLLKTIVMSSTYRQCSNVTEKHLQVDPRNRLLARGPRFRLSAETIRDQALAVSGLLSRKIGGKSVMPPQPDGIWKSTYSGEKWHNATDEDRYRRGLYTYLKRTSPYPSMITFDAGSREVCQIRRTRTNTPLQALVTLNDPVFLEAAGALAERMRTSSDKLDRQIEIGFRRVLVRKPTAEELQRLVELYRSLEEDVLDQQELLTASGLKVGDAKLVAVANVLLNLDETLTK